MSRTPRSSVKRRGPLAAMLAVACATWAIARPSAQIYYPRSPSQGPVANAQPCVHPAVSRAAADVRVDELSDLVDEIAKSSPGEPLAGHRRVIWIDSKNLPQWHADRGARVSARYGGMQSYSSRFRRSYGCEYRLNKLTARSFTSSGDGRCKGTTSSVESAVLANMDGDRFDSMPRHAGNGRRGSETQRRPARRWRDGAGSQMVLPAALGGGIFGDQPRQDGGWLAVHYGESPGRNIDRRRLQGSLRPHRSSTRGVDQDG